MTVCVQTKNPLLLEAIRQLLPAEEFCLTEGEAELTILDGDTLPPVSAAGALLVLCSSPLDLPRGAAFLPVPFDLYEFAEVCRRAARDTHALTPTERRLLVCLQAAEGAPVSREALMRAVWGETGSEEKLNLYIHYLRKKLEKDGVRRIFSARGKGYYYQC